MQVFKDLSWANKRCTPLILMSEKILASQTDAQTILLVLSPIQHFINKYFKILF